MCLRDILFQKTEVYVFCKMYFFTCDVGTFLNGRRNTVATKIHWGVHPSMHGCPLLPPKWW